MERSRPRARPSSEAWNRRFAAFSATQLPRWRDWAAALWPCLPIASRARLESQYPEFLERQSWQPISVRLGFRSTIDNTICYFVITMIRTQISLTEEEYEAAKIEAQRLGISLAELLRRSLRNMLPVDESKPWMQYAGMVETGDPTASQRIDDIVYGRKD